MKIITCDHCQDITEPVIEIGSGSGRDLFFKSEKKTLSLYRDLHFCSQKCFMDYFFGPIIK